MCPRIPAVRALENPRPSKDMVVSPVPAYITEGSPGCITMLEIERLARKSFTGSQCAPLSIVFQMPPDTLPVNHVDGTTGLTTIDRTRPPILPGPSHVQSVRLMPATDSSEPRGSAPGSGACGPGAASRGSNRPAAPDRSRPAAAAGGTAPPFGRLGPALVRVITEAAIGSVWALRRGAARHGRTGRADRSGLRLSANRIRVTGSRLDPAEWRTPEPGGRGSAQGQVRTRVGDSSRVRRFAIRKPRGRKRAQPGADDNQCQPGSCGTPGNAQTFLFLADGPHSLRSCGRGRLASLAGRGRTCFARR